MAAALSAGGVKISSSDGQEGPPGSQKHRSEVAVRLTAARAMFRHCHLYTDEQLTAAAKTLRNSLDPMERKQAQNWLRYSKAPRRVVRLV